MRTDYGASKALTGELSGALRLSLHSGPPGDRGLNEVAGGSYKRRAIAFRQPSKRVAESTSTIEYEGMPGVTLTHYGVWDESGLFEVLPLAEAVTIPAGATYRVKPGDLQIIEARE